MSPAGAASKASPTGPTTKTPSTSSSSSGMATAATSAETYCLCGQQYQPDRFMIECDRCREWFHGACVGVRRHQAEDIDRYHCPRCAPAHGPSPMRVATNRHRHDRYDPRAADKPVQTGTRAFVEALGRRKFRAHAPIALEGRRFDEAYLAERGFEAPVLFASAAGLELRVPPAGAFDARAVERHCGAEREIDVIDVDKQANFKMPLGDFVDYFASGSRARTLNVLSLEFSDTSMSALVQPPLMARRLDWARQVWPPSAPPFAPSVQKYCIMSARGSYTDFHVDFGGTTVWYHVLHGRKLFYMVPPTERNLALYRRWSTSDDQHETFFGDLVDDDCTLCPLERGQTMFIPTGWIHAVLTPEDSLVFGGNFLHSHNIELQLQINEIEKQVETPSMFRFPLFETIHWYAGAHLLQRLRRVNEEQQDEDYTLEGSKADGSDRSSRVLSDLPPHLLRGIRVLLPTLKEWHACKSYDSSKKQNIPDSISSGQLVRDLSRELRKLEKLLAPPHSSHSSSKKKKKKSRPPEIGNRHFLNISKEPQSSINFASISSGGGGQPVQQKKSLKLTLPKPIMYVPDASQVFSNSSQDSEDAELTTIATIASKSGMASYSHNYDSQDSFGGEEYRIPGEHGEFEHHKNKKGNAHHGKIKSGTSRHHQGPPPSYASTEHSILKSHLVNESPANPPRSQKSSNQWTISKSQIKNNDTTDEQILFTNENLSVPGSSTNYQTAYTTNSNNQPFDVNGILYVPGGVYSTDAVVQNVSQISAKSAEQNVPPISADHYNPEFIIDRKTSGLLPDYSPTKSMTEYLGAKQLPAAVPSNFANNSDPYSQSTQDDAKEVTIVHTKQLERYGSVESLEYMDDDDDDRITEEYVVIDNVMKKIKDTGNSRQPYVGGYRGGGDLSVTNIQHDAAYSHCIVENANPPPSYESSVALRRTDRPLRRKVDHRESIYDYEDQDEVEGGELYIDEAPKSKKRKKVPGDKSKSRITNQGFKDARMIDRVPGGFTAPKNGIESLLQASAYAGPPAGDNQERDAVVGMLSIGQSYGLARADSSRRPAVSEGPPIRAVHKDEDYVYPSLEMSSDDEEDMPPPAKSRSRAKRKRFPFVSPAVERSDKEDESWSPHARLGRLVPRQSRPARKGSRREAVQAALRAARLKGSNAGAASQQPIVLPSFPGRISPGPPSPTETPTHSALNPSLPVREASTLSSMKKVPKKKRSAKPPKPAAAVVQNVLPATTPVKNVKFKKGMKTAKQRLGKILKIHKMLC